MKMISRIVWVWCDEGRDASAGRIVEALGKSEFDVTELGLDEMRECPRQAAGEAFGQSKYAIVIDARGRDALLRFLDRAAFLDAGDAPLLLRASPELHATAIARLERPLLFLDEGEGPEITRARINQALSKSTPSRITELQPAWRHAIVGKSRPMQKVIETIRLVGPRKCTVLITGETGTGKEVAARAIHRAGPRATAPFVAINCGAIPAALLEAELFGHTKGAFTGATQVRLGRFEQADTGTLFLDEIGDLPMELQAKLLRVLQEREFQRLGSSESIRVDVRIVAATNCDLRQKVREGTFREDLFYRLNVVPLQLPPLRSRTADIRPLAEHFLAKICAEEQLPPKQLTPQAWRVIETHEWPGNVRELENAIASAAILSGNRTYLDDEDFALDRSSSISDELASDAPVMFPGQSLDFTKTVNDVERRLLVHALKHTGGNKKAAAEMLRLKRTTLSAKVRVLDIQGVA